MSILENLLKTKPVITDGAWGTMMHSLGLPSGQLADIWNLKEPGKVESVARAYLDAGSRIILTNTFRANRISLTEAGFGDKTCEINRTGAQISKRAAGEKAYVFGSIGPSGKMLMMGEVDGEALNSVFSEQAQSLAEGGADGIVVETISDLEEAKIAVKAAKSTGLPVAVSMVFDSGEQQQFTMMGNSVDQVARELDEAGADIIGANCGQGIEGFVELCRSFTAATAKPVWIKANAGLPELADGRIIYNTTPARFAEYALKIAGLGASFIGGCCGTTPDFIAQLRREFSENKV